MGKYLHIFVHVLVIVDNLFLIMLVVIFSGYNYVAFRMCIPGISKIILYLGYNYVLSDMCILRMN